MSARAFARAGWVVALAAAYYTSGRFGLEFARVHHSVTLVWPPSGIALAALVLLGPRVWPGIFLGAFTVNVLTGSPVGTALSIAIGNTLEGVVGATLMRRWANGAEAFDRTGDAFRFVLVCMASTGVGALLGALSLVSHGQALWPKFGWIAVTWWLGDMGGMLVLAPAILLWASRPRVEWNRAQLLEALLLLIVAVVLGSAIFGGIFERAYPLTFLCIPLLVWTAFRFGPREQSTVMLALAAIAVRGTQRGDGPFSGPLHDQALPLLHLFTGVIAITGMVLAALVAERGRLETAIRGAHDELGLRFERQRADLARAVQSLQDQIRSRARVERYAEAIVKTMREPLLVLDSDLRVRLANPAYYRLFRVTTPDIEGRYIYELGGRQWDVPVLRRALEEDLPRRDSVEGLEVEREFPRIGLRTMVVNALRLGHESDLSGLTLLVLQDVTERKRANEALRISEERFRAVAETAVDGIVTTTARGRILFFNGASERIFGYSAAEAAGCELEMLMPERHRELYRQGISRFLETGQSNLIGRTVEMAGLGKDGSEFPIELSITSWATGGEQFFTGIVRDISERKRVEQRVRESEVQLARAQSVAHIGSWTWDIPANRVTWSDELYRIYGLEPQSEPITYELFVAMIHPEDRRLVTEAVGIAYETRQPFSFDHRIVRPDGSVRWVHGHGEVEPAAWNPIRMVGTSQDITARKLAEQEIRQLNAELERRVQERTAELRRSNQELQEFAYVAAHDLQEPLRTVAGYTQLLARRYRGKLDEEAEELIAFAKDGVAWMHALIDDLLAYSRVGSAEMRFEPVEGEAILDRALSNLRGSIRETRARVTHDELPSLVGDSQQLALLLQNLIGNAIKFRGRRLPRVHVGAERLGQEWVFSVRDNGMGMNPTHLDRIFLIFQRLHSREEFAGTGIGLAICKRVVERHGGRIWAESRMGEGSVFKFTMPAIADAVGLEAMLEPAGAAGGAQRPT